MYSKLFRHVPSSLDQLTFCKFRISELACEFASLSIECGYLAWRHAHFRIIRLLKSRNDIYITKADKGAGVVILCKQDYINKMNVILGDTSKFRLICLSETYDHSE